MTEKDPVFEKEKKHVEETVDIVFRARKNLEKEMEDLGASNLDKLKQLREDPTADPHDFLLFINMISQSNIKHRMQEKFQKLSELEYLEEEPYFSRLDLKDPNSKENNNADSKTLYIGKFGHTEEEPVVIDWRTNVASVYYRYRYPQKNVEYNTPDGRVVKDLVLKRTFEIDGGELIKYFNNDIQLDENEIIIEKIEKRTGGVLEDIVETIQESQLDIIESDPRQICIVQGTVGSGKSTVAIHKLSHIFFNYPKFIRPERSILIAKNQILVGYLSTLFPKLGIFDIKYGTIRDLIYRLVFSEKINIQMDMDKDVDTSDFDMERIKSLKKQLNEMHEEFAKRIEKVFESDDYESYGGFVYDKNYSVIENVEEVISELEEEFNYQKEFFESNPRSSKAEQYKIRMKAIRKLLKTLRAVRSDARSKTLSRIARDLGIKRIGNLGYKETLIYCILYMEIVGIQNYAKYEYCVVDEGQDFSPLEYLVMSRLVINKRMCILGDLNQSYTHEGIDDWDNILKVFDNPKNSVKFRLDTNYRSTKPIIEFANKILEPYTADYLPKSINRRGNDPEIARFMSVNEMMEKFSDEITTDIMNLDKSIGVIVFDDELFSAAFNVIEGLNITADKKIVLDQKTRIHYIPRGVYLTGFDNAKGLEFGKVYVLGLNLDTVNNIEDAKKAFVAVTRAMNELSVYGLKNDKTA